jgi:hypothetical protein
MRDAFTGSRSSEPLEGRKKVGTRAIDRLFCPDFPWRRRAIVKVHPSRSSRSSRAYLSFQPVARIASPAKGALMFYGNGVESSLDGFSRAGKAFFPGTRKIADPGRMSGFICLRNSCKLRACINCINARLCLCRSLSGLGVCFTSRLSRLDETSIPFDISSDDAAVTRYDFSRAKVCRILANNFDCCFTIARQVKYFVVVVFILCFFSRNHLLFTFTGCY